MSNRRKTTRFTRRSHQKWPVQKSKRLAAKWRKLRELRQENIASESRHAKKMITFHEAEDNRLKEIGLQPSGFKVSHWRSHAQGLRDLASAFA